jgi:hypothetical protein
MANYNTSGYVIPAEIANWPANGPSGFAPILAPFGDFNNNQVYDPQNGDYPAIMGDQACYLIYNDAYAAHTESGGNSIGVEVHCMIYEINDPVYQDVRNTVFARYIIANKSANNYTDFHIALWADFDIGDPSDDYVGTDVGRNMIYGYNGDSIDGIYGINPPAQGVVFLNHPLTASMYYNNVNGTPNGNPATALHYYDYMKAKYGDGQQMTFGADGRNPANPSCNFFCPDNTDPAFAGSSWTEASAGNAPDDRRMLGGVGPYNLNAGDFISFDVAYVFGDNGVASLQTAVDNIQTLYNQKLLTATAHLDKKNAVGIYPNPAADFLNVDVNGLQSKLEVSIINSSGQLIKSFRFTNVEKTQIDIRDLNTGVYQLKISGENTLINKSFTIVR